MSSVQCLYYLRSCDIPRELTVSLCFAPERVKYNNITPQNNDLDFSFLLAYSARVTTLLFASSFAFSGESDDRCLFMIYPAELKSHSHGRSDSNF